MVGCTHALCSYLRRGNHNRPLISPYEANDKFIAIKFKDDSPPKPIKKSQVSAETDEDTERMITEYAKAHCILDKVCYIQA